MTATSTARLNAAMGADRHSDWLAQAASTLDWWADAGVDLLVDDKPRDWLAAADPIAAIADIRMPPATARAAETGGSIAIDDALPATFDAFAAWRIGATVPEADWRGPFIAATGPTDAAVLVAVDCPDTDDMQAGSLLSGSAGRLFDRMLAAIGLTRADIHLFPVCAKRPIAGRMPREVEARLSEIARHHVGLASPRRILCLGNAASRAIVGTDMPANRGRLHRFNHRSGNVDAVTSFHPRLLIEKPALKAEAWRDLQLLMGDMT